jgi:hypothetical protein
MHLAYSAISTINNNQNTPVNEDQNQLCNDLILRYQAYQTTCEKYSREIAAIQKYMPGWMPKFR